MNIGHNIKLLRIKNRYTRKQIAESAGCTPNNLYMIEKKDSKVSLELAFKIADAMGVDINAFRPAIDK